MIETIYYNVMDGQQPAPEQVIKMKQTAVAYKKKIKGKHMTLGECLESYIERNADGTLKSMFPVWVFVEDHTTGDIKLIYGALSDHLPGANPEDILRNATKAMLSSCVIDAVRYREVQFCEAIPDMKCDIVAIFISGKQCTQRQVEILSDRKYRSLPIPVGLLR